MPADLDAFAAPTDSESGDAQHNPDVWELRHRITVLSAELRAAREVVEAAHVQWAPHGPCDNRLCQAVATYDHVAGPGGISANRPTPGPASPSISGNSHASDRGTVDFKITALFTVDDPTPRKLSEARRKVETALAEFGTDIDVRVDFADTEYLKGNRHGRQ